MAAAAHLLGLLAKTHQFLAFTTPPNLQRAIAYGLEHHADDLENGWVEMARKRDLLAAGLKAAGFALLPSAGTYFLTADIRPTGFNGSDLDFCRHITTDAKVSAVPVSAFFDGPGAPDHFARFCFAKTDDQLTEACARLTRHFGG